MNSPVVQRNQQCHLINFILGAISGLGKPMRALMPERFTHAIIKQSHRNPGGQQHGKICQVRKFGLGILPAESNVTVFPRNVQDEEDGNGFGDNDEPYQLSRGRRGKLDTPFRRGTMAYILMKHGG